MRVIAGVLAVGLIVAACASVAKRMTHPLAPITAITTADEVSAVQAARRSTVRARLAESGRSSLRPQLHRPTPPPPRPKPPPPPKPPVTQPKRVPVQYTPAAPRPVPVRVAPPPPPPLPTGGPQAIAEQILDSRGLAVEWSCLDQLWQHESGWDPRAFNASSGAYGIPQALPGTKMAVAGSDWRTNPATQIIWGLGYIAARYGTPCAAWSFWQSHRWY